MESIQSRVETWIKDQRAKILKVSWGPLQWRMKWQWPPWNSGGREHRQKLQQEFERHKRQLQELCRAVKADSLSDLQDILCCMVLSECVYKRPATEMIRAVNKFKADFGGQIVSLERVQPSSDHVPHRYLLAEAGDTLFASFIGTKQYKDVMADANILQGAIFHEDVMEDMGQTEVNEAKIGERKKGNGENQFNSLESKPQQINDRPKPAAHRGFLARAKGIPALELYRLAQKRKRKLVLCGHSLGGAVAALATLAILRVIAVSSSSKETEKVQVKCITFSQPPVGNAALRDYVNQKGWQHYFKSYCIPEDLVPRILSPAYFHHYSAQSLMSSEMASSSTLKNEQGSQKRKAEKLKENEGEQLVIGVGPVQGPFWRLSRLVPLEGVRRQFKRYKGKQVDTVEPSSADSTTASSIEDVAVGPQSLEIQEGADGISLKPFAQTDNGASETGSGKLTEKNNGNGGKKRWRRVPSLPSYVPFGELYLLGNSSVESLSGAEYSKLTSVRSMIVELRERLQSHSMKSYRSRFQRIYDLCMNDTASTFFGMEQLQQFPHLQQWLGLAVAGAVELGHIVESPIIRTATSIVPLGWNGIPGEKNAEPLKVDITGFRLHLCTLVHAQVNGKWCSTTVESFPSAPAYSSGNGEPPELQKIRVLVGAPLRRPPKQQIVAESFMPMFPSIDSETVNLNREHNIGSSHQEKYIRPEGLSEFFIFCTSDFTTAAKEVHVRTRRVRLLGLEGAGKTSLFKAILGQGKLTAVSNIENPQVEPDFQDGIAGGLCYSDSPGVNLQELAMEASRFKDELWRGIRDLSRKTDLIVLVHNLSHKIPRYNHQDASQQYPALSLLLDEAKALGIPWVLAITNKFSVSAHQQRGAINSVIQAYQASPSTSEVINSCPYIMPGAASASLPWGVISEDSDGRMGVQKLLSAPIDLVRRPFQRKDTVFPVEGVNSLCQLVHRVLRSHEEASLEELARDRLSLELAQENAMTADKKDSQAKASSLTSAAVGASFGAGVGIILAVVMGAASALRKP
ncbi:Lipase, class 3 [Corchorus capsularis]|uniref:Lipase, class 3 n=1 Tax=Corchorus capsularis TaxID=210143 RepID=A0A1R3GPR0_COCAP|nr:Lipase, class 3 [Corchorus capsularis]